MKEVLLTSSVLILALLFLRRLFRRAISRRVQYALWGLVLLRLLVPVSLPAAGCSVLTAARPVEQTVARRLEERPVYLVPVQRWEISFSDELPEPTEFLPIEGRYAQITGETGEPHVMTSYAMNLEEALFLLWAAGAAAMGIWMLAANLRFRHKLRKVRIPYPVEGARYPAYLVEEGLPSPCLFGLPRPAVYLTPAAVNSPERLRHVMAHEEAHGRHGDPLWALLRCVCLAVYWFNPLVWAAALASKADCELACDEAALARLGEAERIAYGRTLLSLVPVRKTPANPMIAATTMTAGKRQLKDRVTRVAENRKTVGAALLAVVLLAAALCAVTFTGAASEAPVPLGEEELAGFNQDFFGGEEGQDLRCRFLSSFYTCPQDVDIFEFLYWDPPSGERDAYWASIEARIGEADYRQGQAGIRCNTAQLNQVFRENLGLTLEEMNGVGMEKFTVSDEEGTLSFERRPGDTGVLHISAFTAGEREGDLVRLYYDAGQLSPIYSAQACLTLRERSGGAYWIVSNQAGPVPDGPLAGEDLEAFSGQFEEGILLRQLLASNYAAPEDIDLFSLFYNGAGLPQENIQGEERQAALAAYGWEDPGVDLIKIPAADMDAFLYPAAGLCLGETNRVGLGQFVYLPEYDAYYDFHGDTNFRETTYFTAGEWKDGLIRLYYDDSGQSPVPGERWKCLTLRDTPGGCRVVSNLPCEKPAVPTLYPAGEPWMTVPLDGLEPVRPEHLSLERETEDMERPLRRVSFTDTLEVAVYRTVGGKNAAALVVKDHRPLSGSELDMDRFFTIGYDVWEDVVDIGTYENVLGRDGFWISYRVMMGASRVSYFYFGEDGGLYRLLETPEFRNMVDLDGDGQDELLWTEPGLPDPEAGAAIAFSRGGEVYLARIQPLLREAWPEMESWYDEADPYGRRIRVSGDLEPPEGWGGRPASFRRDIYFDGENLLVYKEEPVYTDHVRAGIDAPEAVLEAARQLALADYGEEHMGIKLEDGEIVPAPAALDDWRISGLAQVSLPRMGPDLRVEAWMLDCQFHAAALETVSLAGSAYLDEDGWLWDTDSCYLLFRIGEDGERIPLSRECRFPAYPSSPLFPGAVLGALLEERLLLPSEAEPEQLFWMVYGDKVRAMDLLGTYGDRERQAALSALAEYAVRADEEESGRFREILDTLERNASQLTEAGREAFRTLLTEAGRG